ncbi:3'-5' exonuclease [Natronoarchaeum rubrum]|uniref:3'-5' exonuclease n=1 Tax=Natronoarchaeum rubrum TaxID=755311 RepID=UPI002111CC2F|nr:3'-5' exonuclease [Natronoarchaeum rubrum]
MTGTHICLVHGAPGCGKTHTLLDAVEDHATNDDIEMFDVYLANFTNNGREATADDLIERGIFDISQYDGIDEDDLRGRCRTLHSIALQCCPEIENPQEQVISMDEEPDFYGTFCREYGLDFKAEETNPLELIQSGKETTPRGNKLFALDQWLHAQYLPTADRLAKISKAPVDIELPNSRVRELLRAWNKYKRDAELYRVEHHDYVDICLEESYVPDVRLLGIDEFQDLSPVEYALFKQWRDSGELDWIYIAGDVNQSIYSFRCASPYYLARTEVDERRYLTDSYRCPEAVSAVARGILEAEDSITRNIFRTATRGHGYTPEGAAEMRTITDDERMAETVRSALDTHDDPDDEEKATVYLLTRTNYQLGILSNTLQRHGVPFDAIGDKMNPWPEKVVDCLIALRALRRGTPAPQEPVDTLLNVATNSDLRKERFEDAEFDRQFRVDLDSDAVYFPPKIKAAFPSRSARTIVDVLDLTDYQQDMLRGALESNAAPYPERIQVGTIHEAKGLEAPCVFLFSETTQNILDRYQSGEARAEEHRIYYVGATRASESLHVVDGFFDGPRIPIFADGLPGHDTDATTGGEVAN